MMQKNNYLLILYFEEQIAYIKTHKPGYQSLKFNIDRPGTFENNTAIVLV